MLPKIELLGGRAPTIHDYTIASIIVAYFGANGRPRFVVESGEPTSEPFRSQKREPRMFLCATLIGAALALQPPTPEASVGPFAQRGYYVTFPRMPTYDLADWSRIVDGVRDDGGNTLVLWIAGGFRSKKYPITWRYNTEHENVRDDFVRALIDHAHSKGVRILLGFTPFGYDGVNQYALEHPELKAVGPDGEPTAAFGIGCWGYNLCPSKPESQRFMLDYVREMAFDFYPNTDGLLIESSDYAVCHCENCDGRFFEREFAFVRQISDELWARKPDATIVVYPHYFSGADAPGLGAKGAKLPFDPRWTLMFTPHSAHPEPSLIKLAKGSFWFDDAPARHGPAEIRAGAQRARDLNATGYIPSLEAFTYVASLAEEGQEWLKGERQKPLGFGWLVPGDPPYDELPILVNRIAYREFSRNPDFSLEEFRLTLGQEIFGADASSKDVDDLLELQAIFNVDRTWRQPSMATSPARVRAMAVRDELTVEKREEIRAALERLEEIAARHEGAASRGSQELGRIARWAIEQWTTRDRALLRIGE